MGRGGGGWLLITAVLSCRGSRRKSLTARRHYWRGEGSFPDIVVFLIGIVKKRIEPMNLRGMRDLCMHVESAEQHVQVFGSSPPPPMSCQLLEYFQRRNRA